MAMSLPEASPIFFSWKASIFSNCSIYFPYVSYMFPSIPMTSPYFMHVFWQNFPSAGPLDLWASHQAEPDDCSSSSGRPTQLERPAERIYIEILRWFCWWFYGDLIVINGDFIGDLMGSNGIYPLVAGWCLTYPSEKYERQLGWWHSQLFLEK